MSNNLLNLIDTQNSLIIDVTYNCNARCEYCQWGNPKTSGRKNQPDDFVYIDKEILKSINTQRVVLSGGEPLLRLDLEKIIKYYSDTVSSVIVITNGFLLNNSRLESLINAGLTGVTFSIDGLSDETMKGIRKYNDKQIVMLRENLKNAIDRKSEIEIGINTVVSAENIYNDEILELLLFANNSKIDWIKFQPIFDDGYVGRNANNLLLSEKDANRIEQIGIRITKSAKISTNPLEFWLTLSSVLCGKKLKGISCGLDTRQTIAQKGEIKICSWIDYPKKSLETNNHIEVLKMQKDFQKVKSTCKTDTFCFCLQNLNHIWEIQ